MHFDMVDGVCPTVQNEEIDPISGLEFWSSSRGTSLTGVFQRMREYNRCIISSPSPYPKPSTSNPKPYRSP